MSQADDASIVSESLTVLDCDLGTCGNITVGTGGYETTYFGMNAARLVRPVSCLRATLTEQL